MLPDWKMNNPILLDGNLLIALSFTDHVHHRVASEWFKALNGSFATCPITQSALVRFVIRNYPGQPSLAADFLARILEMKNHVFLPDDIPCTVLPWQKISGYRQVTDAYLVSLVAHHRGQLATLDQSLAAIFSEAILVQ